MRIEAAVVALGADAYQLSGLAAVQSLLERTQWPVHLFSDGPALTRVADDNRFSFHLHSVDRPGISGPFLSKITALDQLLRESRADVIVLIDADCVVMREISDDFVQQALGGSDFAMVEQPGVRGSKMNHQAFFDFFMEFSVPAINPMAQREDFPHFRYWNSGVVIARPLALRRFCDFALQTIASPAGPWQSGESFIGDQDLFQYWLAKSGAPTVAALPVTWNDCYWWNEAFPGPDSLIRHYSNFGKGPTWSTLPELARARQIAGIETVVVSYQSQSSITRCLLSAADAGAGQISIWDNASTDDTVEWATQSGATIWRSQVNLGFARALNRLIFLSRREYLLVLTPDCEVSEDFVEWAIGELDGNPSVALVVPQFIDGAGRTVSGRQPAYSRRRILWEIIRPGWSVEAASPLVRRVLGVRTGRWSWAIGACLVARREAVIEIGGLDSRFFVYMEDVDLGKRLSESGWSITAAPMVLNHAFSEGSHIDDRERLRLLLNARAEFAKKHYGPVVGTLASLLAWVKGGR